MRRTPACIGNGVLDEGRPNCDDNGVPNACDIAAGTSEDLDMPEPAAVTLRLIDRLCSIARGLCATLEASRGPARHCRGARFVVRASR